MFHLPCTMLLVLHKSLGFSSFSLNFNAVMLMMLLLFCLFFVCLVYIVVHVLVLTDWKKSFKMCVLLTIVFLLLLPLHSVCFPVGSSSFSSLSLFLYFLITLLGDCWVYSEQCDLLGIFSSSGGYFFLFSFPVNLILYLEYRRD